jgi:2-phosphoglycolate phosphatase
MTHPAPRKEWLTQWRAKSKRAMLFDLDGTLLDTAPDLGGAANKLRVEEGLAPMALDELRPFISQGARGMVTKGMGITVDDPRYEPWRARFLAIYEKNLVNETSFWPGMDVVVDELDRAGVAWGIVTNKVMRFTEPILRELKLWDRCAVVVGGDTTPHAKPHPAPIEHSMGKLGLAPQAVVYVGDDFRDIQSGYAAGAWTIAAAFGYHSGEKDPHDWGADHLIRDSQDLYSLIR